VPSGTVDESGVIKALLAPATARHRAVRARVQTRVRIRALDRLSRSALTDVLCRLVKDRFRPRLCENPRIDCLVRDFSSVTRSSVNSESAGLSKPLRFLRTTLSPSSRRSFTAT
jgi:hypothetical protein